MKTLNFNARQIVRAIRAACLALAFALAFTASQAQADPVYTPPYYLLNGTAVTGSGSSSAAYFNDAGTTGYTVTVGPTANLSDANLSEIEIDHGTVDNQGTLTYTGSNEYLGGVIFNTGGTLTNSGTINAPSSFSVQDYGTEGTVTNTASGSLLSASGTYFSGGVDFTNAGKIVATSPQYGSGIEAGGASTVRNSGTITSSYYGVQLSYKMTSSDPSALTNSGTISSNLLDGAAVAIFGTAQVTNQGGTLSATNGGQGIRGEGVTQVTNNKGVITSTSTVANTPGSYDADGIYLEGSGAVTNIGGTISASGYGEYGIEIYGYSFQVVNRAGSTISGSYTGVDFTNTVISGTVPPGTLTNEAGATIAGASGAFFSNGPATVTNAGTLNSVNSQIESQGVFILAAGTVTNSGSIYLAQHDIAEGVRLTSGQVTNSGAIRVLTSTTAFGIDFDTTGTVTNTKRGRIEADGAAGIGISITGSGTVSNYGTIRAGQYGVVLAGDGSSLVTGSGTIQGSSDAIVLEGKNSSVTVSGTAVTKGEIEAIDPANGNVLHFNLTGLTSTEAAAFKVYVAAHPETGAYKIKNAVYAWDNFSQVTDD